MTYFWTVYAIDVLIAVIAFYFFLTGISTATAGSKFYQAWAGLFCFLVIVLAGSLLLNYVGQFGLAKVLASIPAALGVGYGLFVLLMIIAKPRWN